MVQGCLCIFVEVDLLKIHIHIHSIPKHAYPSCCQEEVDNFERDPVEQVFMTYCLLTRNGVVEVLLLLHTLRQTLRFATDVV